jgi:gamma-glutamyltranspeptidase/glutathione hydrolase
MADLRPVWLPGGTRRPRPARSSATPIARRCGAASWPRVEAAGPGREAQIEAARRAHASGFVAEAIDGFLREACVLDATGARRKGVLTGQDMADWQATWEAPLAVDHTGWTVWKCGAWSQGPVLLQVLQMLAEDDLGTMDPVGAEFVHLVAEALKRAFADRESYYGDPALHDIPVDVLLSRDHNAAHRADIGPGASHDHRPRTIPDMRRRWRPTSNARLGALPRPVSARANPPWRTW